MQTGTHHRARKVLGSTRCSSRQASKQGRKEGDSEITNTSVRRQTKQTERERERKMETRESRGACDQKRVKRASEGEKREKGKRARDITS